MRVVPTVIFLLFALAVGFGALLSGAPSTPQMPGVRVPTAPQLGPRDSVQETVKENIDSPTEESSNLTPAPESAEPAVETETWQ